MKKKILIEISARHAHLSDNDLALLFGSNYQLTSIKSLSQSGQFSSQETVVLEGPKGKIENIRVLGPNRSQTQVEVSKTDAYLLGIEAPVKESADLGDSVGGTLIGPKGKIELEKGVIVAQRHIHASPKEAQSIGIKDGDLVSIETFGERPVTFHKVIVRVEPQFKLAFHIDTDEGNAAGITNGDFGEIIL